jgi:hypothetical protein
MKYIFCCLLCELLTNMDLYAAAEKFDQATDGVSRIGEAASESKGMPWRCPANVKLDLLKIELQELLTAALKDKNEADATDLRNKLQEIERQRKQYEKDSYWEE